MHRLPVLFAVAPFLAAVVASGAAAQVTESTVVAFTGTSGAAPGESPMAMIQASDGNFYGFTAGGGAANLGTIFKLTPAGAYSVLHSFGAGGDGQHPVGLIQGLDGNLYGATYEGGTSGVGTVYKISLAGSETVLHSFAGIPGDGSYPEAGVVQGPDGSIYGTTDLGGGPLQQGGTDYVGTVYKIGTTGTYTLLHRFEQVSGNTPPVDGSGPNGLLLGTDGILYGTTSGGGTGGNESGTVFTITTGGASYSILYNFDGGPAGTNSDDGSTPLSGLIEAQDGNFYGLTDQGGDEDYGTAYQITPAGVVTTLNSFGDEDQNGENPVGSLLLGSDGNFYGATNGGGQWSQGTVFEMDLEGDLSVLYPFGQSSGAAGDAPLAGVVQGSDGNVYGTTSEDGPSDNDGTIYKIAFAPVLPAPVKLTGPASVAAGASFTLTYAVLNAYKGAQPGTMNLCFASNTAGDTTGWAGTLTGEPTAQTRTVTASTVAGTYSYALTCGGIESSLVSVTVAKARTATVATASVSPNPASIGQAVTLRASVTHATGTAAPTGSVSFAADGITLGSATVASGVASITAPTNGVAPGSYAIVATYSGDTNYAASTSSAYTATLDKAATSTTVAAAPTTVTPPASVTLTATVKRSTAGSTGTPGGSVTFSSDGVTIGSANLNSAGVATYTTSTSGIPAATYPVIAKYNGSNSDFASTSASTTVTVK